MPRLLRHPLLMVLSLAAAVLVLGSRSDAEAVTDPEPATSLSTVPVLDTALAAKPGTFEGACHTARRPGAPGVATQAVNAGGATAALEAKLAGGEGDWDLAVFDRAGRAIAAGASPDAQEVASGWAHHGGELTVQACRRSGDAKSVRALVGVGAVDTSEAAVAKAKANAPQLVDVETPTRGDKDRLTSLGLDMSEHGGEDSLGVILRGAADEAKLRKAGFEWDVEVEDMVAQEVVERRVETSAARATRAASPLPSGREGYRVLADYEAELKALAKSNPTLVKLIELPRKTFLGRTVFGVEIAENVDVKDGKPAFFNMGVHHAREWPAGELTMEWAIELVKGYRAGDSRAVKVVKNSRNIVVPIVNPDGFNASRSAGALGQPNDPNGGRDEAVDDTAYIVAGAANGGEYRRKNCRVVNTDTSNCLSSAGLAENGTDPNRNYGGLWGGPGADTNPATQTYRGPGPFSEPESDNIRQVVSGNQVMSLITNHTTAALFLRAPGLASLGDPVDEGNGYKALGDAVARETGYFSQKSFELYDTTGTTEDWAYNATGAFGFTNEIYCGAPNYRTGDCDDPAFHPRFATTVKEWTGDNDTANHTRDPAGAYDGKGNREGFYIAAESAMDPKRHSVLDGTAPEGTTLRLKKTFKTQTSPVVQPDGSVGSVQEFDDKLETIYDVGSSGRFTWHVNPSTRPIVAKATGRAAEGPPSAKRDDLDGGFDPTSARVCPEYQDPVGVGIAVKTDDTCWNDHAFEIPVGAGVDNDSATVRFEFSQDQDWDLEIYEDVNGNRVSDGADKLVATSGNGATSDVGFEEASLPKPVQTTRYVARMINFAASGSYQGSVIYNPPPPRQEGKVESYTLTCERGGKVLATQRVTIARGEVQSRLTPCGGTQGAIPGTFPTACAATSGFVSVGARRRGRGANLSFRRRVNAPVTVRVFQQSRGRKVLGERLVASFTKRRSTVRWNGKANRAKRKVADGYYFVRYSIRSSRGTDTRRVVLQRFKGRFTKRADFYRRGACDLLPRYKLERPVFGGSGRGAPLGISYRLARAGRVTVTVTKGTKVVKRFAARSVAARRTIRLRLSGKGLARGEYRVRLAARESSGATVRSTLVSRKL